MEFCIFCKLCLREDDILVDLEKCCKMRIWTRKSALIQPRTRLGKSDAVVAAGGPGHEPREPAEVVPRVVHGRGADDEARGRRHQAGLEGDRLASDRIKFLSNFSKIFKDVCIHSFFSL